MKVFGAFFKPKGMANHSKRPSFDLKVVFHTSVYSIETDASDYVVGVVLTQHDHPMDYHSETLSDVVHKYPTYDKEMYSILQACRQWRHHILGKETIIHTNHKPV